MPSMIHTPPLGKLYLHHPLVSLPRAEVEVVVFEVLTEEQSPTFSSAKSKLKVASADLLSWKKRKLSPNLLNWSGRGSNSWN